MDIIVNGVFRDMYLNGVLIGLFGKLIILDILRFWYGDLEVISLKLGFDCFVGENLFEK